ncbi:MAG: hypothetical protein VYD85_20305 [Pseudomonadota bacterium]|nr:hypothetical protein [Pseudomonadota bacterium]
MQFFLFACIWWVLGYWRAREPTRRPFRLTTILRGNWPFFWGAVALSGFIGISMLKARPAGSNTGGVSLWGAKAAQLLGWIAEGVWFWAGVYQKIALKHRILEDTV